MSRVRLMLTTGPGCLPGEKLLAKDYTKGNDGGGTSIGEIIAFPLCKTISCSLSLSLQEWCCPHKEMTVVMVTTITTAAKSPRTRCVLSILHGLFYLILTTLRLSAH